MSELPAGWIWKRVGEVGDVQIGRQLSPSQLHGRHMRPYLRVANVHDNRIDYSDVLKMNFTPSEFATFSLRAGDVLLNEGQSLELVGRSAIYDGPPGMCFQNTLIRFRPREVIPAIAQAIFKRWLDHGEFMKVARQTTSIAHLGSGRFAAMQIPVPPVDEQRRIAEILDALDMRIAAEVNELAKRRLLRDAVLRRAMAPGLQLIDSVDASRFKEIEGFEEDGWSPVRLGSLLTRIEAGVSPDLDDRPAGDGEWGVLKVSAIGLDGFRPMENKVVLNRSLRQQSLCVNAGDLIMTRANTSELVGLSCVAPEVSPHLMLSDKTLRLVVDSRKSSPEFVDLALGASEVRKQIQIAATGTSASMKNISQSSIRALMVPFSSSLMMENVCRIDSEMRSALETQQAAVAALRELKRGLVEDLLTGRVRV